MFRYDGHSGGVTPGPIPNPEVKSARVSDTLSATFPFHLVAVRPLSSITDLDIRRCVSYHESIMGRVPKIYYPEL